MSDQDGGPRDAADPDETTIEQLEPSEDAETEFHPFDEVDEDFQPGPLHVTRDPEGTWSQVDQTAASDIPPLSLESLICLGDKSSFVLRNHWGEILCTFSPDEVQLAPNGEWRCLVSVAVTKCEFIIKKRRAYVADLKKTFKGELGNADDDLTNEQMLYGMLIEPGQQVAFDPEWLSVEPIRPQCRHLVRQGGSFDKNAAHRKFYRLCAARRTTEGTFMTVSDTGVYACDMREPHHAESAKLLDDFDALKIEQGKHRKFLPMFSNDPHGIFSPPQAGAAPTKEQ